MGNTERNGGGHNGNASKGSGVGVGVGHANEEGRGFGRVDALAGGRAKGSQGRSEGGQGGGGEVAQMDRGVISKVGGDIANTTDSYTEEGLSPEPGCEGLGNKEVQERRKGAPLADPGIPGQQ